MLRVRLISADPDTLHETDPGSKKIMINSQTNRPKLQEYHFKEITFFL